jgi:ferrous iron transport protein B
LKPAGADARKAALVGSPNVGKSLIFNRLTGAYAVVSNYPGTTVEVFRGLAKIPGGSGAARRIAQIIDTPGMYSLYSLTDEERVTRNLLMEERPDLVVHVVDTKNLSRMLGLTLQLLEAGLPTVLALNIIDEAEKIGLEVDAGSLQRELGIPVVKTSGALSQGIDDLARLLSADGRGEARPVEYDASVEAAIAGISRLLAASYGLSRRAIALLLLQRDTGIAELVSAREGETAREIEEAVRGAEVSHASLSASISARRQARADAILRRCLDESEVGRPRFAETLSRLMIRPLTGFPIMIAVLYLGLYLFVGRFGAGTLVGFIEGTVFGRWINPPLVSFFTRFVPWPVVRDLFVGDFGIFTLGLRYALAIILPIVTTFFLAFSILEDSGYFPRIALLADKGFKRIGMNGRAVIPIILGFGCDTMATVVTRTLETRREKVIATLLLALAIPCSAQLGVILALLSRSPLALAIWGLVVLGVFLLVGALTARLLPGERPSFAMELPPLRLPRAGNVLSKTYSRLVWYLKEILPVFVLVSVGVWLGRITGIFELLIGLMKPVTGALGLPPQAGSAFLFGFFRRDYGAAGLFDLAKQGLLSYRQLLVASITLTLFIPCVAQLAVMWKERGWKTSLAIVAFILPFSFAVGFAADRLMALLGVLS